MAMSGSLMPALTLYHIHHKVIGYLRTMDGRGCLITAGVGHLFIMVVGISIIIMVGSGYRIINGVLHGFRGEELTAIMAGLRWNPGSVFLLVSEGDMIAGTITGYS